MTARLIDLKPRKLSPDDFSDLQDYLAQLVGEPFRLARVSYGDELTLHFGDLRPGQSPKVRHLLYGAYILGMCASPWLLKSGSEAKVVRAGLDSSTVPPEVPPLSTEQKKALETMPLIEPESRVLAAVSFVVKSRNGLGLQIELSDGSAVVVLPAVPEPDDSGDDDLPELADWELLAPHGLLSVGPGPRWSFEPSAKRKAEPQE